MKVHTQCKDYEEHIKHLNSDVTINKTQFKGELLDYFKQYGIQEQSDGKNFPKGMQTIVQNTCFPSNSTSEAIQLASVAKMTRSKISNMDSTFMLNGNFPSD